MLPPNLRPIRPLPSASRTVTLPIWRALIPMLLTQFAAFGQGRLEWDRWFAHSLGLLPKTRKKGQKLALPEDLFCLLAKRFGQLPKVIAGDGKGHGFFELCAMVSEYVTHETPELDPFAVADPQLENNSH